MLRWWLSWIAIAWLTHASVTLAQSDPGRDAEARGLFEAGRAAFDQGRYQDALGYFDRAYQLSRRPQLLYNIGQVHDRLRHDEDALQAFQQYLKQVPSATNRTEVEHRIDALRQAMFGMLHFTLTPAVAQIWIDGEAKTLDGTGRVQVTTGSHEIVVRAQGYSELRQRMTVRGGDAIELPITLQAIEEQPAITPATVITTPSTVPEPTPAPAPAPAPQILQPQPTAPDPMPVAPPPATPPEQQAVTYSTNSGGGSAATTIGWIAAATSGVMLLGGGIAALTASSKFDALDDDCRTTCSRAEIDDRGESIKTMQLLANVGLIGGGALAGLAMVLFIAGSGGGAEQPAQPPALVIGPTSIFAQGSF